MEQFMGRIYRMRTQRCRLVTILISSLVVVLALGTFMAGAQSALPPLQRGNRPANLYTLQRQSDATICGSILMSLNKPARIGALAYAGVNEAQDLLLASELQVPWQRKEVHIDVVTHDLDYLPVDIANNGITKYVYRWDFFEHDRDVALLFIQDQPLELWSSRASLSEADLRELHSNPPQIAIRDQIKNVILPFDQSVLGDELDFNLLRVTGKTVVLVAGSYELTYAVNDRRQFTVFALFYNEAAAPSILCEFLGTP